MFTMDQIHRIRDLYFAQGIDDLAEIARIVGCDWRTVKKYVDKEDFSPKITKTKADPVSKLDPFKPLIDQWLAEDLNAPRKQRHTAKQVHKRLKKQVEVPGYDCSYRLTAVYVSKKKKEFRQTKSSEGYIPLVHFPGEAQADFGCADFYENGKKYEKAKYLVLSFPYSNGGYLQLNYGENLECLLEGLKAVFEHIGGVPREIWFDNTKTIVTRGLRDGDRKITERFRLFSEHYRFRPVFMNPESGNEKGNVENKVGYLRRNELVPVPRFLKLPDFNRELLGACDQDMEREHYDKETMISSLFEEDRKALLPLPSIPFDTAFYTSARTDKYGKFTLDKGKHRYSASPAFCEDTVRLKITSSAVTVMDSNLREIVTHRRLYGENETESMEWLPYLKYIAKKPRSLRNSGIYGMLPDSMQKYMDSCIGPDKGRILRILSDLTDRTGFESAVNTVNQALLYSANDPDSLQILYNRLYSEVPVLPELEDCSAVPPVKPIPFHNDLAMLDSILHQKGGALYAGC